MADTLIELKGEYDSFLRQEVSDGLAFCLMRNHHCCWNTRVATGISSSSLPLQLSPILVCSPLSRSFNLVVIGLFLPGGSIIIMIILCALLPIQLFLSSLTTHRIAYQQTTQQQQHHNIILYSDMVTSIDKKNTSPELKQLEEVASAATGPWYLQKTKQIEKGHKTTSNPQGGFMIFVVLMLLFLYSLYMFFM